MITNPMYFNLSSSENEENDWDPIVNMNIKENEEMLDLADYNRLFAKISDRTNTILSLDKNNTSYFRANNNTTLIMFINNAGGKMSDISMYASDNSSNRDNDLISESQIIVDTGKYCKIKLPKAYYNNKYIKFDTHNYEWNGVLYYFNPQIWYKNN